ncbi:MAG: BlaI/MecI/CopY family transcriptional regulator [Dehalococcoidia bacterium]|nr:BlaI/MecI/CopY family transcriptional regulator [Dehalococcoidia bacterium]
MAKFLGQREAEIMEVIWDLGPATVAQVHDHLDKNTGLAYTTIMTIMGRLAKKGLLDRTSSGRAYVYSAKVSRDEFNKSVMNTLVDGVIGSFAGPALSYFVEKLSEEDASVLDELERVIQEKKAASEKK